MAKPPILPPAKPPRLQKPCDEDMTARDSRRSTETALAFMATSMPPIRPPNRNMAIAAVGTLVANATISSPNTQTLAKPRRTAREPYLDIR